MVKNSICMKKGIVIIILSTIEIFLFSGYCRNLQEIFIGILIHVLLILSVSIIFIEKEMQHILYYTEIFFNYLNYSDVYQLAYRNRSLFNNNIPNAYIVKLFYLSKFKTANNP